MILQASSQFLWDRSSTRGLPVASLSKRAQLSWFGKYVSALIVPAFEELSEYAKKKHIEHRTVEELVNNPDIRKMIEERINDYQKDLASYEQIKRFVLLPKAFTMETGELTNTLKIRRAIINKRYRPLIDAMYAADYRKKNKSVDKSTDE